jgi:hypothetical protein
VDSRCRQRNAGAGAQDARISERAVFTRRPHVDERYLVTVTPQVTRGRNADDTGADDRNFSGHETSRREL